MHFDADFLTPVLALVAWTLLMWIWMYATRLPPATRWVADNYNHLHEQPTIFYALMFCAALTGGGDATAVSLAWAYEALRILA